MTWRLKKETAGSGALGDIASHAIDQVLFLLGDQVTEVSGRLQTFREPAAGCRGAGRRHGRRRRLGNTDPRLRSNRLSGSFPGGHRPEELPADRDLRRSRAPSASTSRTSTSFSSWTPQRPPASRASAGSWSQNRSTRTWTRGGRRATSSAGSTPSRTKSGTSCWPSTAGTEPSPSFEDGLEVQRILAAVEESAAAKSALIQLSTTEGA
jgi:hypothetical protein